MDPLSRFRLIIPYDAEPIPFCGLFWNGFVYTLALILVIWNSLAWGLCMQQWYFSKYKKWDKYFYDLFYTTSYNSLKTIFR